MPRPAPYAFTEQRIERRAERERQAPVISKKREGESDDSVTRPSMDPPMEGDRCETHRPGCPGVGGMYVGRWILRTVNFFSIIDAGHVERRILKMVDRLHHAEIDESDS